MAYLSDDEPRHDVGESDMLAVTAVNTRTVRYRRESE